MQTANSLPIRTGVRMEDFQRDSHGVFTVKTTQGELRARHVCLALGRRGSPRKLGAAVRTCQGRHSLLDAEVLQGPENTCSRRRRQRGRAAAGLAEQHGNEVTLSYRKRAFSRLKARNENRIYKAMQQHRLSVCFETEVDQITADQVRLRSGTNGSTQHTTIANDEVFIFAGGVPPFSLLEQGGVSFDPADRPALRRSIAVPAC
ncbi:MAG: NAD(P)-binding domain-containing protein [Phycisphaerales bacterium]